ncbi:Adrenodoxin-like protein, mitochondrial, partial [Stegodyphus mimosarum]
MKFSLNLLRVLGYSKGHCWYHLSLMRRIKFSFVTASGEEIEVEGEIGKTILSVAQDYDVGVDGACEGQLACTTCHVYVDENYEEVFPEPDKMEEDMLDIAHFLKPNSRL